jgi:hypothetical protein
MRILSTPPSLLVALATLALTPAAFAAKRPAASTPPPPPVEETIDKPVISPL